jgi:uncharacterized protein (DUF1697 family)
VPKDPPKNSVTYIALIRGINVGAAKRIAMADLRQMCSEFGYKNIRSILNSGNLIFDATKTDTTKCAAHIQAGIVGTFKLSASVVVITAAQLNLIIDSNPLREIMTDPARFLVAFVTEQTALSDAEPLVGEQWLPDQLVIGQNAAYLWCANGILVSKLATEFAKRTGDRVTSRNWSTVLKLRMAAA